MVVVVIVVGVVVVVVIIVAVVVVVDVFRCCCGCRVNHGLANQSTVERTIKREMMNGDDINNNE